MSAEALTEAGRQRRAHSIGSAIRDAFGVWYALLGGILAWTIHLLFVTAFVGYSCSVMGDVWAFHLATTVTLVMTAIAIGLAWRLLRRGGEGDDASATDASRLQFLGRVGLMIGVINLALIAVEGSYVFLLASRRCG